MRPPRQRISNSYWCAYCQQGTNAVGKPSNPGRTLRAARSVDALHAALINNL